MASNIAARAATAGELVKFRGNGQWSKLGLAFLHPVTVYTARVNQATFDDSLAQLTYDGGTGTLASVLNGMTIAIGTTAGARDVGLYRVRKTPSATILYINQSSNKKLANDQYITIYDDFRPWKKEIFTSGPDITLMDYDIELNDTDYGAAVLRVAPEVGVLFRDSVTGEVTFTPPSPALSVCYDGTTISSYLYAFPGSASSGNLTSATGTAYAVYNAAGEYRWSVTATDSLGRETKTYRRVLVDPTTVPFELEDCSGVTDDGWSFSIICHDDVTKAEVLEGALCVLYSEDWYNGVKGSIGKITGYENIVAVGRIDGEESIDWDSEDGSVSFIAHSANYILSKLRGNPIELTHTTSTPTTWKQIEDMTVDKALAHVLIWTTTLPLFTDCFLTGSTVQQDIFAQPGGSVLDQLNYIAGKIFAGAQNNNLGQMSVQIDPQMMSSASRAALTVVMDITDADMADERNIERKPIGSMSRLEMSALVSYDGATPTQVYSRAIGDEFGDFPSYDDYSVTDQDECNYLAGRVLAAANNEYENLEVSMPSNNRLIDVCPPMLVTLTLTEAERGITFAAQSAIPRRVRIVYDAEIGAISVGLDLEIVVTSTDGVTYYPPPPETENLESAYPDFDMDFVDFPPIDNPIWFPPIAPPPVTQPCSEYMDNYFPLTWAPTTLYGSDPNRLSSFAYFPCTLRSTGSYISLKAQWFADAATNYAVYAIKDGNRVFSGTITQYQYQAHVNFTPISDLVVDGFEVALTAGIGTPITGYLPGETILETGISVGKLVGGTSAPTTLCVSGQYYCIEAIEGSWSPSSGAGAGQPHYNFTVNADSEFRIGGVGYTPSLPGFSMRVLDNCLYTEAVTSVYGRTYFMSGAGGNVQWGFVLSAGDCVWPTGSLTFGLRNAWVLGRRMTLRRSTLFNVCAIE